MNWLLILMVFNRNTSAVTQAEFQTKFLCEKAAKEMQYINDAPENQIPLSAFYRCVQVHKVEKPKPEPEIYIESIEDAK